MPLTSLHAVPLGPVGDAALVAELVIAGEARLGGGAGHLRVVGGVYTSQVPEGGGIGGKGIRHVVGYFLNSFVHFSSLLPPPLSLSLSHLNVSSSGLLAYSWVAPEREAS